MNRCVRLHGKRGHIIRVHDIVAAALVRNGLGVYVSIEEYMKQEKEVDTTRTT